MRLIELPGYSHERVLSLLLRLEQLLHLGVDLVAVFAEDPGNDRQPGVWRVGVCLPFVRAHLDPLQSPRSSEELFHEGVRHGIPDHQPLRGFPLAEPGDEVARVRIVARRKAEVDGQDQLACGFLAARTEGRLPCGHLVQQHAHVPHVDALVVTGARDHLGREVIKRSAECLPLVGLEEVRPAEVGQLDVVLAIQKNIFWLDVAVDDLLWEVVQVVQRLAGLVKESRGELRRELASRIEPVEEASTSRKLHAKIHVLAVFEIEFQPDDPRVLERI
mmetsp:Transcript_76597/g.212793  ORF Transcript_76597/g.212793 Transcript_76597/m.212793 type:complete len:275 (+) Transcript_76597:309-1133(+)